MEQGHGIRLYGEKEKNKGIEYHKNWGRHIMSSQIKMRHYWRNKFADNLRYFNGQEEGIGETSDNSYMTLLNNGAMESGGEKMDIPVIWTNFNKVRNKVKVMMGEFEAMGFDYSAEAINKEARSRRGDFKKMVMAQMAVSPIWKEMEMVSGIELGMNMDVPETEEEFNDWYEFEYKDNGELVIEACLRYNLELYRYIGLRLELYMDAYLFGECHAKSEIVNGFPVLSRVNPFNCGYEVHPDDDDYLTKSSVFFEFYYLPLNKCVERWKIGKDDLENLESGMSNGVFPEMERAQNVFNPFIEESKQVFVFEARWLDYKTVMCADITDQDGNEYTEILYGEDAEKRYDVRGLEERGITVKFSRKKVSCTRFVTLLGECIVAAFGECRYQLKDFHNPAYTHHDYVSFKPFTKNGVNTSDVEQIKKLQDYKGFLFSKIQLEIVKSGGRGIAVDTSKMPKDWGDSKTSAKTLLYYMKSSGLIFYNSQQGEIPKDGYIPIQSFDMGIGRDLDSFMALSRMLDAEIDEVVGINQARMGEIVGANQLKSVTEMSLAQSQTISLPFNNKFRTFEDILLTKHANHIRMSWHVSPNKWAPVIGDVYHLFLQNEDADFSTDYYVIKTGRQVVSIQTLQKYLMVSLEHGAIAPDEALELELQAYKNVKLAIRNYVKKARMNKRKAELAAQQQAEQQMAMQEQQQAAKMGVADRQGQAREYAADRGFEAQKLKQDGRTAELLLQDEY